MRIWCFDDKQSSWGKMLFVAARRRGYDARLFKKSREVDKPGFLFYRMEQGYAVAQRREALICLDVQGVIGIQKREAFLEYENKIYQAEKFSHWLPETYIINREVDAKQKAIDLGFPVVSKSRSGSASSGVRLLADMDAVLAEAKIIFGRGLHTSREVQQDYLLYQKFLPGNDHSYRVARIGRYHWMYRVINRPHTPLSSGSGVFECVQAESEESLAALAFGAKFLDAANVKWGGCDLLYDHNAQQWRVIETTLAWALHTRGNNVDCPIFNREGVRYEPPLIGADQFEMLLDELERGVFDG